MRHQGRGVALRLGLAMSVACWAAIPTVTSSRNTDTAPGRNTVTLTASVSTVGGPRRALQQADAHHKHAHPHVFPQVYIYNIGAHACDTKGIYALETTLPTHLAKSEHRTLEPEAADFFFVPARPYCHSAVSPHTGAQYIEEVIKKFVKPLGYWETHRHRHMFVFSADHGFCGFVPGAVGIPAIQESIILSHWGLTHAEHHAAMINPTDALHTKANPEAVPCHVLGRHVVVPPDLSLNKAEPCLTAASYRPHKFLFYGSSGFVSHRGLHYSHGVRQTVFRMFGDQERWPDYTIVTSGGTEAMFSQARFCLAPTGGGWGSRLYQIMQHGCIPVIIQPDVVQPWEELLEYSKFSVQVAQSKIYLLPEIMDRIEANPSLMQSLQEGVCAHAKHFAWEWNLANGTAMQNLMALLRYRLGQGTYSQPETDKSDPSQVAAHS